MQTFLGDPIDMQGSPLTCETCATEAAAGRPAWHHAVHAVRGPGGASKYPAGAFACGNQPPYCAI